MFRNIQFIALVSLLVLLAAAPIIAAEKGSVNLQIEGTVFAAGSEIQPGLYSVKWQSNSPETTVTFVSKKKNKAMATVQGKMVDVDKAFDYDSFLASKDSSGRLVMQEIQLRGKKVKIVFE